MVVHGCRRRSHEKARCAATQFAIYRDVSITVRAGEIVGLTGLTLASDMKEFIDAGICDETFLWNPIELGYASGYAAVAIAKGEITGAAGETYEAGELGTLTIEESADGGTISYLNKLNVFNKETVNDWIDIL